MSADPVPEAAAVLCLHGQPGTAAVWHQLQVKLAEDFQVLAVDRPGHGVNALPATGFAGNAEYVRDVVADALTGPVILVAHSWAGGPALYEALDDPRVAALVLVAPVGGPGSVTLLDRMLAAPFLGPLLVQAGVAVARLLLRHPRLARSVSGEIAVMPVRGFGHFRRMLRDPRAARTFLTEQRALVRETRALAARLGDVARPVLVVSGDADNVVPLGVSRRLAEAVPGAHLAVIPGARHLLPATHAARLAELLLEFVASLTPEAQTG